MSRVRKKWMKTITVRKMAKKKRIEKTSRGIRALTLQVPQLMVVKGQAL